MGASIRADAFGPGGRRTLDAETTGLPQRSTLRRLTSLRAVAAAAVFAYHLGTHRVWAPLPIADVGYVGVGFFFVLSGFVLAWSLTPGTPSRTFYRRRFARVYPSHIVVTVVALLLITPVSKGWRSFVPSMLLVQSWSTDEDIVYGMNGVTWSLACEVAFYAAFPLTVMLLLRCSARIRWLVGMAWYAGACAFVLRSGSLPHGLDVLATSSPVIRFGEFLLGVIAALAIRDGWRPRVALWQASVAVAASAAICHYLPGPRALANEAMVPAFVLMVVAAAQADLDRRGGMLTSRWLVVAGEVSFAFYLVHELVMVNLQSWLGIDGVLMAGLVALVAVAAALALHHVVERPCEVRLRGTSRRVGVARSAALEA